jgi:putative solute:sodium symporter small subunit
MYIPPTDRGSGEAVTSEKGDASGTGANGERNQAYWRANLKLGALLLAIWFVVSFGFGILLVEPLNRIPFFGFKLGFWWAQQGAIYVFIVLIFVYAWAMKRLDRKYDVHDD